jgi:hypothetical protein
MLTMAWRRILCSLVGFSLVAVPVGQSSAKPVAGAGKIQGVIMDHDTNGPVSDGTVHLWIPKGGPAKDGWTKVDDQRIEATTSATGSFVFDKVAPGNYILAFAYPPNPMSPRGASVEVVRKEDATDLTIVVSRGKTTDVGKVWVQR